jgi:FkbM family methyltransferase
MLRALGHGRTRALMHTIFRHREYQRHLRDSGLRLMLFRAHRDPSDIFGECYFGKNYLGDSVRHVVDVGAHTGGFSRACYHLIRPLHIHCFEPNPEVIPQLRAMETRMPGTSLHVHNVAAGADDALVAYKKAENPLLNSLLEFDDKERGFLSDYNFNVAANAQVNQVTLDSVFSDLEEIDFLKIDTQGYELSVLAGAKRVLAKTRVVMIEINFVSMYSGGSTFPAVHQVLTDAGFLLVQLDAPSRSRGVCVWTDAMYVARSLVDGSHPHSRTTDR